MSKLKKDLKQERENIKKKIHAISAARLIVVGLMIAITACSYIFYDYFFGNKSDWCTTPDTGTALFDNFFNIVPLWVK